MSAVAINLIIIVVTLVIYYRVVLVLMRERLVSATVQLLLGHFKISRYTVADVENVITFGFSVLLQMCLFVVLVALTSVQLGWLWPASQHPWLLIYGAVLGLGEMLLGSFLALIVIKTSTRISQVGNPLNHWQVVMNSGWMRLFNTTVRLLPLPVAIPIVVLYVGVEELIIRGVVLNALLPLGTVAAVLLSTAIFAGYQVFNLPSWRVAMLPVTGALVIGPVHGLLYTAVPEIWPLVVAHVTYFTIVALTYR